MLVAVVSAAGVLVLWLLPTILGCGALSIAYCLFDPFVTRSLCPCCDVAAAYKESVIGKP